MKSLNQRLLPPRTGRRNHLLANPTNSKAQAYLDWWLSSVPSPNNERTHQRDASQRFTTSEGFFLSNMSPRHSQPKQRRVAELSISFTSRSKTNSSVRHALAQIVALPGCSWGPQWVPGLHRCPYGYFLRRSHALPTVVGPFGTDLLHVGPAEWASFINCFPRAVRTSLASWLWVPTCTFCSQFCHAPVAIYL